MAFLDNSGDIILDAVLTDTGRFRMARGDFRITKFALGDDEIDYALYNKNHPSGSAYYDLEILKTPILEAFTNNTSNMSSKLMTIPRTNILHMPVFKLHNGGNGGNVGQRAGGYDSSVTKLHPELGAYIITVDESTERFNEASDSLFQDDTKGKGIMKGASQAKLRLDTSARIAIELGLDTTKISPSLPYPADLQETQFIFEMDSRLGSITTTAGAGLSVSYIDDDQIASYFVGSGGEQTVVVDPLDSSSTSIPDPANDNNTSQHRIRGPRNKIVQFKILANTQLTTSTYLFEKLGGEIESGGVEGGGESTVISGFKQGRTFYFIDTFVKVTAATVGVSIDIPIRFIKKKN